MTKPKIRILMDGRIGWPDVVQYQLPDGRRLTCPPRVGEYPDHSVRAVFPLSSTAVAKKIALGEIKVKPTSLPYKTIIHDLKAYRELCASGAVYSRLHRGPSEPAIDNRVTS